MRPGTPQPAGRHSNASRLAEGASGLSAGQPQRRAAPVAERPDHQQRPEEPTPPTRPLMQPKVVESCNPSNVATTISVDREETADLPRSALFCSNPAATRRRGRQRGGGRALIGSWYLSLCNCVGLRIPLPLRTCQYTQDYTYVCAQFWLLYIAMGRCFPRSIATTGSIEFCSAALYMRGRDYAKVLKAYPGLA